MVLLVCTAAGGSECKFLAMPRHTGSSSDLNAMLRPKSNFLGMPRHRSGGLCTRRSTSPLPAS
ncbi:hypothetical protein ACP4OV_001366 [Aristida adscensionis]